GKKGGLYKSVDGGTSWAVVNLGTNVDLFDISFPDKKAGYICTSAGRYIYYDGVGWSTKTVFSADNFIAVGFPTKDEGFLSASSGRVWRTLDGGTTWDTIKSIAKPILGSHFITANVGYIVGGKGFVQRTITGGLYWSDTLIYPDSFLNIDFRAVFFPLQNFGFIGGNEGTILRTSDGGSNWYKEKTNITDKINRIYAPSQNVAFAVGENGTILRRYEAVGIEEDHVSQFRLYPNPATDYIQIVCNQQFHPLELQVYTLDGQLVLKKSIKDQQEFILPVAGWAKGNYLINLISKQGSQWGKVIVN
ncbi:YCF48-related protein, partial [Bacteroidota bacterium]